MSNLASDTFTGSNGAAWSSTWTLGRNPNTGAVTPSIQSNRGRLTTGSAGSYNGNDRISRRVNITAPVDAVALFSFQWTTGDEAYPSFWIRSTNTALDTQGGYAIEINKGSNTWKIIKSSSYAGTDLSSNQSKTWTTNVKYWCRFGVVGDLIRARIWDDGSSEPTTWTVSTTDSTHTTAGSGCGISVGGGAAASRTFDIDDFSLDTTWPETLLESSITLTNTVTSTASLAKPLESAPTYTIATSATASLAKPLESTAPLTINRTATITSEKTLDSEIELDVDVEAVIDTDKPLNSSIALTLSLTAELDTSTPLDGELELEVDTSATASLAKPLESSVALEVDVDAAIVSDKVLDANQTDLTVAATSTASLAKPLNSTAPLVVTTLGDIDVNRSLDGTETELEVATTASASLDKPVNGTLELTVATEAAMSRVALFTADAGADLHISFLATIEVERAAGTRRHTSGGWNSLAEIVRQDRYDAMDELFQAPIYCPNDGELLESNERGLLHCKFDGWVWNGQPVRI